MRTVLKGAIRGQKTGGGYKTFLRESQEQQTALSPIVAFRFDAPSPDDIVRANQRKAFTRLAQSLFRQAPQICKAHMNPGWEDTNCLPATPKSVKRSCSKPQSLIALYRCLRACPKRVIWQADVAVLVVDASRGEFEAGFEAGGQTREHALLVRSLGVTQLAVAVNKMDQVNWQQDRFKDITSKLGHFLKQAGFKESDVFYVPTSGLSGENLTTRSSVSQLTSWYSGPSLLEQIDSFKAPQRSVDKPFRLCVSDVFKDQGSGFCVTGKIEAGYIQPGERILAMPPNETCTVKGITLHDEALDWAAAGDHVSLTVTGMDIIKIKCLSKGMNAIVEIQTQRPVSLELYKDYKELGRFMLRYVGSTIAAGVVTEIKK
ncbi:HBS1-like protein [Liparis tanakae]|uniref:HBS1-like protein n=1 Tax=Liparis tanakae TaxID=230148 RepID=A0A4Z2IXD0_9TELE|nr:HBS1-like protein [Liparis tanakae]